MPNYKLSPLAEEDLFKIIFTTIESGGNDWHNDHDKEYKELAFELEMEPNLDLLEELYSPPIKFEVLPEKEDEYKVHRILVENVVIRFVEDDVIVIPFVVD